MDSKLRIMQKNLHNLLSSHAEHECLVALNVRLQRASLVHGSATLSVDGVVALRVIFRRGPRTFESSR